VPAATISGPPEIGASISRPPDRLDGRCRLADHGGRDSARLDDEPARRGRASASRTRISRTAASSKSDRMSTSQAATDRVEDAARERQAWNAGIIAASRPAGDGYAPCPASRAASALPHAPEPDHPIRSCMLRHPLSCVDHGRGVRAPQPISTNGAHVAGPSRQAQELPDAPAQADHSEPSSGPLKTTGPRSVFGPQSRCLSCPSSR
jgi:hypothetical protein